MAPKVSSDQMHSPPTARKRNPKGFWFEHTDTLRDNCNQLACCRTFLCNDVVCFWTVSAGTMAWYRTALGGTKPWYRMLCCDTRLFEHTDTLRDNCNQPACCRTFLCNDVMCFWTVSAGTMAWYRTALGGTKPWYRMLCCDTRLFEHTDTWRDNYNQPSCCSTFLCNDVVCFWTVSAGTMAWYRTALGGTKPWYRMLCCDTRLFEHTDTWRDNYNQPSCCSTFLCNDVVCFWTVSAGTMAWYRTALGGTKPWYRMLCCDTRLFEHTDTLRDNYDQPSCCRTFLCNDVVCFWTVLAGTMAWYRTALGGTKPWYRMLCCDTRLFEHTDTLRDNCNQLACCRTFLCNDVVCFWTVSAGTMAWYRTALGGTKPWYRMLCCDTRLSP